MLGTLLQGNGYYCNGLFNNGSHLIDLARMFLGEPKAVIGRHNKAASWLPRDLNVDGLIMFKNDLMVSLQSLSRNYDYFNLALFGERGRIEIADLGFKIKYQKKLKSRRYKGYFELDEKVLCEGRPRSMLAEAVDYLVSFLEGRAKVVSSGEEGLSCLKILLALKRSAEEGGRLIKH
jgi:predicted dehydrogenase